MKFSGVVWLSERCVLSGMESPIRSSEKENSDFNQGKYEIFKSGISSDHYEKIKFPFKILLHLKHPSICYESLLQIFILFHQAVPREFRPVAWS